MGTLQFPQVPLDFDEVAQILDNIVDGDFPEAVYSGLTGGIYLLPDEKHNARIPSNNYYVLGEYCHSRSMGDCIYIYYGSFRKLYPKVSREQAIAILHGILAHELRHHMEGRAGERGLEIEDENFVQQALRRLGVRAGKRQGSDEHRQK